MKKEKKILGSPEPVNISSTKKILTQMTNCICKIKIKGAFGTGFFCKIPFGKNEVMNCLMTNYHVLDEKYYKENKDINLLLNDDKEIKSINTKIKRKTFFNKDFDIALIELKQNDGIRNFLELDDNLFKEKEDIFFVDKSIYILQYPKGKEAAVSYGQLKDFCNYDVRHTCSTDNGSSGSPILNLENNKVIGIHKEGSIKYNYNQGTFLKLPLKSFIMQNKNSIKINIDNKVMNSKSLANNNMDNIMENNNSKIDNSNMIKIIDDKNTEDNSKKEGNNDKKKISPFIICPICKEPARYGIRDYKINLFNCKNKHFVENILFKDFESTQIIDESLIICNKCNKKNKSNTPNNEMYICLTCNLNLCPSCKSEHEQRHIIIKYEQKYYMCSLHCKKYYSYCITCKKDICDACKIISHENHYIKLYDEIILKVKNLEKYIKELKPTLNKFKVRLLLIIDRLKNIVKNIDIYYKIVEKNVLNFNINNINYNILQNINYDEFSLNFYSLIEDLKKILEDNNYKEFIPIIFNIFNKMNKNEIELIYNVPNNENTTYILNKLFVLDNKNLCKIIYNNQEYDLTDIFHSTNIIDNKLKIKLVGINNVINLDYMFENVSQFTVI